MNLSSRILSDFMVYTKYARYLPELKRRETWIETVDRNKNMHIKKYPELAREIEENYKFVYDKKVLPSMRGLQFGGKPIELSPNRQYNCSCVAIDDYFVFAEIMFLLLGGSGVGISVQKHHIEQLPTVKKPTRRTRRHLIGDSIEGWADSIKVLMKAYFFGLSDPVFDFSDIRPKGAILKTSGGRAPGPQPLKDCLHNIRGILDGKDAGDQLRPIEAFDIVNHIADAVLSGGIRRAAIATLFSLDDEEMLYAKAGSWWLENPQRGRSNNSVVLLRHRVARKDFKELWNRMSANKTGEPAFVFSNNKDMGFNPCFEASLVFNSFCNLTTVNVSDLKSQDDYNDRARAAAYIGTLQAGFTDFHYLRDIWRKTTEKDALIGVSMTGIASGEILKYDMSEAGKMVVEENKRVAEMIGINSAARTTLAKPEGSSSLVLGTSSGVHAWHAEYYIRRIRLLKSEPAYQYLINIIPDLLEDDFEKPHIGAVLSLPIKAPKGAVLRDESPIDLLNRIKKISKEWVKPGHQKGDNMHNVSATISIKDDEWGDVGDWMWVNREFYNGLSTFPFDCTNYKQQPLEECSKYKHDKMVAYLEDKDIDFSKVVEEEDNTKLKENVACGGGQCELV